MTSPARAHARPAPLVAPGHSPPFTPPAPAPPRGRIERITHEVLRLAFGAPTERDFSIRLWTGETEHPVGAGGDPVPPRFTIVLQHPGALRRMFFPPTELTMAEAYVYGHLDIEGRIEDAILAADRVGERMRSPRTLAAIMGRVLSLPDGRGADGDTPDAFRLLPPMLRFHRRKDDARAVGFTYDLSNEFYELFLDEHMQYTCAYYVPGTKTLDEAQAAKLEHVCRKLMLKPGMRLLDIGCGWGGMIRYAATHYGVEAVGITLSREQAAYANARIAETGLGDRCRAEVRDYRDLPDDWMFDRVMAAGMFEHVGARNHASWYTHASRHLKPGGVLMNHAITTVLEPPDPRRRRRARPLRQDNPFMQKYVFPTVEMPTVDEMVFHGEAAGLELRDVENLREHYILTFREWHRRLEARREDAVRLLGEQWYRIYRLYLAAFAPRFATRWMAIHQVLFSKPDAEGRSFFPPTREHLYASLPHHG